VSPASRYGVADRLLLRAALGGGGVSRALQRALAGVEDALLEQEAALPPPKPVFVTALPRAGTTILLSLLARAPSFASHTYRDMPFVLSPYLWGRVSGRFRRTGGDAARAHGDGLRIDFDSPEAFDELLWMLFWPEKYQPKAILRWTAADRSPEFDAFFARHMHKVIAARAREPGRRPPSRYLSKNNANIARLSLLPKMFPDCRIVIPVRDPWSHATSLLRQHRRFRELHGKDGFARRYMAWLGHFEFGAGLRPIRFEATGGELRRFREADRLDFWLRYWRAAHDEIAAATDRCILLIDYARLTTEPQRSLAKLAATLGVAEEADIVEWTRAVRAPAHDTPAPALAERPAYRRAVELYESLRRRCLNRADAARSA